MSGRACLNDGGDVWSNHRPHNDKKRCLECGSIPSCPHFLSPVHLYVHESSDLAKNCSKFLL